MARSAHLEHLKDKIRKISELHKHFMVTSTAFAAVKTHCTDLVIEMNTVYVYNVPLKLTPPHNPPLNTCCT